MFFPQPRTTNNPNSTSLVDFGPLRDITHDMIGKVPIPYTLASGLSLLVLVVNATTTPPPSLQQKNALLNSKGNENTWSWNSMMDGIPEQDLDNWLEFESIEVGDEVKRWKKDNGDGDDGEEKKQEEEEEPQPDKTETKEDVKKEEEDKPPEKEEEGATSCTDDKKEETESGALTIKHIASAYKGRYVPHAVEVEGIKIFGKSEWERIKPRRKPRIVKVKRKKSKPKPKPEVVPEVKPEVRSGVKSEPKGGGSSKGKPKGKSKPTPAPTKKGRRNKRELQPQSSSSSDFLANLPRIRLTTGDTEPRRLKDHRDKKEPEIPQTVPPYLFQPHEPYLKRPVHLDMEIIKKKKIRKEDPLWNGLEQEKRGRRRRIKRYGQPSARGLYTHLRTVHPDTHHKDKKLKRRKAKRSLWEPVPFEGMNSPLSFFSNLYPDFITSNEIDEGEPVQRFKRF